MTLIKMAWRNIWRNKRRTVILLCAMSIGLFGILFSVGFVNGWVDSIIDSSTNKETGHIGIFAKNYFENPAVEKNFSARETVEEVLKKQPGVKAWTTRVKVNGLVSNAEHSNMINIMGVDPKKEPDVSIVASSIKQGRWLEPDEKNGVVIGQKLAERFETKLGRKLVLMSQQIGGDVGSLAVRIVGIFQTDMEGFDESIVYINLPVAQTLVNLGQRVTEVNVQAESLNHVDELTVAIRNSLNPEKLEVLSWKEQLPFSVQMIQMAAGSMSIIYFIFFVAMAFGIVNTLLMAVNERYREIGIMLAIGTKRIQIVLMVAIESFFLAVLAVILGSVLSLAVVHYFHVNGMDLSSFAKGMEAFGISKVLHPSLHPTDVLIMSVVTFIIAILFSLFPAIRAARFKPIEAIQKL